MLLGRQLIGLLFLQMFEVLDAQLRGITGGVIVWDDVVIAYEPVWAIGTGKVRRSRASMLKFGCILVSLMYYTLHHMPLMVYPKVQFGVNIHRYIQNSGSAFQRLLQWRNGGISFWLRGSSEGKTDRMKGVRSLSCQWTHAVLILR